MFRSWVKLEADYSSHFKNGDRFRPVSFFPGTELEMESMISVDFPELNVKVNMRLDRIDYDPDSGEMLIIDYKSSASPPTHNDILRMDDVQLPLYVVGIAKDDYTKIAAAYWSLSPTKNMDQSRFKPSFAPSSLIKEGGRTPKWAFDPELYTKMNRYIREVLLRQLSDNIRAGFFNPPLGDLPKSYDMEMDWLMRIDPEVQRQRQFEPSFANEHFRIKGPLDEKALSWEDANE
jgi:hypothetical protein